VLTILFDGVAYGMLLFILSVGLSVTLGLMNFINLAHGAFAMLGGYLTALLMTRVGFPFLATLPIAFVFPALVGIVLERTLYRRLYGSSALDQVLFTIGLVYMAMPIANLLLGDQAQQVHLPPWLSGRFEIWGVGIGVYRLFIIALCAGVPIVMLVVTTYTLRGTTMRYELEYAPLLLVASLVGWLCWSRRVRFGSVLFWSSQAVWVVALVASVLFNVAVAASPCAGRNIC